MIGSTTRALKRLRRKAYHLRAFIPGLSFQHEIEIMVGPVGHWKALQRYQFRVLQRSGLRPEHSLLDLGCGPLQGGIPFIDYLQARKYVGVDINLRHLDAARIQVSRYKLSGKEPQLFHSSRLGDEFLGDARFDFIWASQILYYFDACKMSEVFEFARRRLKPGGKFLGDIINPAHFDSVFYPRSGFLRHEVEEIQQLAAAQGLATRSLGELHQYDYPRRLLLRSSLLMEFALSGDGKSE